MTEPPWKIVDAPLAPVVTDTLTVPDAMVGLVTSVTVAVCEGGVLLGTTETVVAVYAVPEQMPAVVGAAPGPKQKEGSVPAPVGSMRLVPMMVKVRVSAECAVDGETLVIVGSRAANVNGELAEAVPPWKTVAAPTVPVVTDTLTGPS